MARTQHRWVAAWSGLVLLAAGSALVRGYELAAAVCAGLAIADALGGIMLLGRTLVWAGRERAGLRRMVVSWGAVTLVHWATVVAFPGTASFEAIVLAAAGVPPFLVAYAAYMNMRYMSLVADAVRPEERPVEVCSGWAGSPPRNAVLAATDRRVVAFVQQPGLRPRLEEIDSIARPDIVDVDVQRGDALGRVSVRSADHEVAITHAPLAMADRFFRRLTTA